MALSFFTLPPPTFQLIMANHFLKQDPPVFNNIVFPTNVLSSGFYLAGDSPNPFFLFMPRLLYTLEQVSQRSTITLSGLLTTCNLMGISFPHTLAHNHRYVYWFPFTWSQCDNFSSLTFPAGYEIWIFL